MSALFALGLAGLLLANLLVNAGILWLGCTLFCRQTSLTPPIGYRQALTWTLLIFLVGWGSLMLLVVVIRSFLEISWFEVARFALPPLGILLPLVILKWALGQDWWRTLGVWLFWRVLTLAQSGLMWFLLRPHLRDLLPA